MTDITSNLIKRYKDKIKNEEWGEIYYSFLDSRVDPKDIGQFTKTILSVGYDPLEKLNIVPEQYLYGVQGIDKIILPHNIVTIKPDAFRFSGIKEIEFNNQLQTIEENSFDSCFNLRYIDLPKNLIKVGKSAFSSCGSVTSITLPTSDLCRYGHAVFRFCISVPEIYIPEGVRGIPNRFFSDCAELRHVVIPYSVDIMSGYIFNNCNNLKEIIYAGTKSDFNEIVKSSDWLLGSVIEQIVCKDGVIKCNKR